MNAGAKKGPPQTPSLSKSVVLWWPERDKTQCTDRQTDLQTGEVRIILLNKPTLWANVLAIFSQAPAHRRPLDNGETSFSAIICEGISPLGYLQKVNRSPTQSKPYNTLPPFGQRDSWSSYGAVRAYSEVLYNLWGESDFPDS